MTFRWRLLIRLPVRAAGGLALLIACCCSRGPTWAQAPPSAAPAAAPPANSTPGDATQADAEQEASADQQKTRLLDRRPEFDVVVLNSNGQTVRIETELLDLPGGQHVVPNPLPTSGELQIRPLGQASTPYAVSWSKIRAVRLWEQMLLDEAIRLSKAGDFAQAFQYIQYLHNFYPRLTGLEEATQAHLVQEARSVFLDDRFDESLLILGALYGRNPTHPALASAVPVVSDKLIGTHWEAGDYASARRALEQLEQAFQQTPLKNIPAWKERFVQAAQQQMQRGRQAIRARDYAAARQAVRAARDILPSTAGVAALLAQIHELAPEVRVGVAQFGQLGSRAIPTLADARVEALVRPTLIEQTATDPDNGSLGPEYVFRGGTMATSDEDLQTTLQLHPSALERGLSPEAISLRLVEMAAANSAYYRPELAMLLDYVDIGEGNSVFIHWKRPYVRPEALLQTPLKGLVGAGDPTSPFWYSAEPVRGDAPAIRYVRPADDETAGPRFVVERAYLDDEDAIAKLLAGEVDAIDRLPPWQQQRLREAPGIRIGQYALPTVHVLTVNWDRPILRLREFRRALCFALDREAICRDVLLGGESTVGFRALSGPFPAGRGATDPIAYAYKQELAARGYQPSLARALVGMAEAALEKQAAARQEAAKAEAGPSDESDESDESEAEDAADAETDDRSDETPVESPLAEPLVLLHGADPVERLACQSIKLYLDQVGVPITLRELAPGESAAQTPHDLHYLELAVWEPLVDARALLGDQGVAGRSTAYMNLALARLEQASNWNEATGQLKEIHEIAHYDLPLIPLWQTYNYFAYLESLQGVGQQPISLYQNLRQWTKAFADQPAS